MLNTEELLSFVPTDWTRVHYAQDYELVEIPESSPTFQQLNIQIIGAFNKGTKKIVRVQNPFLYTQFLIKKEEYEHRGLSPKVMSLFHDTGECKIPSIVSNNLDWRIVRRVKFGNGVSFSPSPAYANKESSRTNGTERAMIFADVLVAKCERGGCMTQLPSVGYDTTIGNCGQVYVKYYDYEFYPKYVAYYDSSTIFRPRRYNHFLW